MRREALGRLDHLATLEQAVRAALATARFRSRSRESLPVHDEPASLESRPVLGFALLIALASPQAVLPADGGPATEALESRCASARDSGASCAMLVAGPRSCTKSRRSDSRSFDSRTISGSSSAPMTSSYSMHASKGIGCRSSPAPAGVSPLERTCVLVRVLGPQDPKTPQSGT